MMALAARLGPLPTYVFESCDGGSEVDDDEGGPAGEAVDEGEGEVGRAGAAVSLDSPSPPAGHG